MATTDKNMPVRINKKDPLRLIRRGSFFILLVPENRSLSRS
jgi:hypothetical protein